MGIASASLRVLSIRLLLAPSSIQEPDLHQIFLLRPRRFVTFRVAHETSSPHKGRARALTHAAGPSVAVTFWAAKWTANISTGPIAIAHLLRRHRKVIVKAAISPQIGNIQERNDVF